MSSPSSPEGHDTPELDDVMIPTEQAVPDHHAHGKTDKHLNEDLLEERAEHEAEEVHEAERPSGR